MGGEESKFVVGRVVRLNNTPIEKPVEIILENYNKMKADLIGLRAENDRLREVIDELLTIEPCHLTGMHDPTHTQRRICQDQLADAYTRATAMLGIDWDDDESVKKNLKRRRHKECYWCKDGKNKNELKRWEEDGWYESEADDE